MNEGEVRAWLLTRLRRLSHGWEAGAMSCYDEEGIEGWRWTHDAVAEKFEALGPWDEAPSVDDDRLREYVESQAEVEGRVRYVRESKQVIVMRKDLNMRKGKMVAQGAHASIAWLTQLLRDRRGMTDAERAWVEGRFTKICVSVSSEEELDGVHREALTAGLTSYLITDAGLTEFGGVPTKTCLAVGPGWADEVDVVTGDLPLL